MTHITVDKLQRTVRDGIGFVIGPSLTENQGHEKLLIHKLQAASNHQLDPNIDLLDAADLLLNNGGMSEEAIRQHFTEHFTQPHSVSPDVYRVIPANPRAVLALTFDDHFRQRYEEYSNSKPVSKRLVTVAGPNDRFAKGSVPYYSLLGNVRDHRSTHCAVSFRHEYLQKRATWTSQLRLLSDAVQGDPLFCIGTSAITERLCDLLTAMISLGAGSPRRLVLLQDDPVLQHPTIRQILERSYETLILEGTLQDIGEHFSRKSLSVLNLPLWGQLGKNHISSALITKLDDKLSYIPRRDELSPDPDARNRLLDSLFRPAHLDWSPYCLDLEFKRDSIDSLVLSLTTSQLNTITRVVGEAGIGKTVVLRSVGFQLSQGKNLCFWFRKSYDGIVENGFDAIVRSLNSEVLASRTECVYFFLDDPMGTRIKDDAIYGSLQNAKFPWRLIVCNRSSELAMSGTADTDFEIPSRFTDGEIKNFPLYLVTLGVANDENHARQLLQARGMAEAKDILCNLWYALPQTKAVLASSVSGEYDRLSGIEDYITAFVTQLKGPKVTVARNAYEMVTVCSGFANTGLPVEVLVNALEIGYESWADLCSSGKPVWGLIYDESSPAIDSWVYRTRNSVVTEIMLKHLNRGATAHSAEFRVMMKLVRACTSGQAPYRQFLYDILITNRREVENRFTLVQAMELYDSALEVFPRAFGKLEHHRSLCKRSLGGDSLEVYDELSGLISRSSISDDDVDSADMLHTSAAAAMLQAFRDGKVTQKEASETIYRHTNEAIGIAPDNLHPVHAQANALLKIGAETQNSDLAGCVSNIVRAANLVERSLMVLNTESAGSNVQSRSFGMFGELRDQYLNALPFDAGTIDSLFDSYSSSQNQVFLVLACRIQFGRALSINKGGQFKKADETIRRALSEVTSRKQDVDVDLRLCRVQLEFEWKLKRHSGPVVWEWVYDDLLAIRSHRRYKNDPFWDFMFGVCLFHQKQFTLADQIFGRLRARRFDHRFARQTRCLYVGEKTHPVTLQGNVTIGAERQCYIMCNEIGTDVRAVDDSFRKNSEEIKFFKIEFSMNGPIAVPSDRS